jgi:hypothetical protein
MRDSRYQVEMCGQGGDQLCGTLVWLGGHADNEENRPYLNTLLIDHAPPVSANQWKGTLRIFGQTATGTHHPGERQPDPAPGVRRADLLPDVPSSTA